MKRNAQVELLRKVWLFEECTKKELEAIARVASPLELPEGKLLTTQGQPGSVFFVIVSGGAKAVREDVEIGTLAPGSCFGEMSLLEDLPRVATVTTTEPTTVLVVHARDFSQLLTDVPSLARQMLVVLARRLRDIEGRYVPAADRVISDIT